MFFYPTIFLYSLIFLLGLQIAVFKEGAVFLVAAAIMLFSFYISKKIGKTWSNTIIAPMFTASAFALLYLIDSLFEKEIFTLLGFILYYIGLLGIYRLKDYEKDQTARGMIAAGSSAAAFFFYTASYGFYLNFLVPLWILMLAFLMATTAVSYQYFRIINDKKRIVWSYSITFGMIMAEVAWVINFWPFGYLTTGVIILMLYYIFWDLIQSYFLNILSKKRVAANVVFLSFLIALVLLTSHWLPVV